MTADTQTNPLIVRQLPPGFRLYHGGHSPPTDGQPLELCFNEAVRWIAGEDHGDSPECMDRPLAAFGMRLNDRLRDDERQLMIPLLIRCVGTRGSLELTRRRSYSLVDSAIREIVPIALDAAKWTDLADRLRSLDPVVDTTTARAANVVAVEVRDEARKRRAAAYAAYDAAADAAADAAYAAYAAYADDDADADARRRIVTATIAAFERAIALT